WAKASARGARVPGEPSSLYGPPTTTRSGPSSRTCRSMAGQSGPLSWWATVARGVAVRVRVSPLARPMRRRPKSKQITTRVFKGRGRSSGVAGAGNHLVHVDAQRAPGRQPAVLVGQVEEHGITHRQGEPAVVAQLALQLAFLPLRVAQ